ncbi:acyl-CoA dehydrogenase family protein [Achromobacter aegrifaciens]|uniref:acyl-CoA dehydrogenase family protein n=1 Tax=Achromobacter aegrifaciens TaxID=1287736 RepID=UPI0027B948DD|nr:acyl-CoA dehydrogenase family protein [Achromobacter aegrifaciens]WLW63924.1 acyl-CoA dehydrogenase family protein [Achromobacter aegrifaciens]
MDLHPTEDQRMLDDAARRFLADRHPPAAARAAAGKPYEARLAQWREIAAQGWPALLAPAGQDGLGLGMREAWIVAEAAGRHLLSLPLAANMAVLPTLCAAGPAAQWAFPVMTGDTYFADAAVRPDGSVFIEGAGEGVRALAVRRLNATALRLEALAPASGEARLDPTMPVARVARPQVLDSVDLEVEAGTWERLRTRLRLLRSAELLGAASAALDMAAAHARERRQFDRAIGANQAIKHRLAEDWMSLDDARLAGVAAVAAHDAGAASAERDSLFAPLLAVEAGRRAAQNAIQVHGALGVTWECDAHLYLKRVLRLAASLQAETSRAELLERIWESGDGRLAA